MFVLKRDVKLQLTLAVILRLPGAVMWLINSTESWQCRLTLAAMSDAMSSEAATSLYSLPVIVPAIYCSCHRHAISEEPAFQF